MVDPIDQNSDRTGEFSETTTQPRWVQRLLIVLISLAALGGFAMVIVYSFDRGKQVGAADQVPIIIADEGPTRVKPDDPGGMKIPFRDKEVYGEFNPSEKIIKKPRLSPPEEKLILKPLKPDSRDGESTKKVPNPLLRETLPKEKKIEKLWEKKPQKSVSRPDKGAKNKGLQQESINTKSVLVGRTQSQKSQGEKPKRENSDKKPLLPSLQKKPEINEKSKDRSNERSEYKIQIASFRSKASAERAWLRISEGNKDLLGQLKPNIVRATVKNRGTWYRLQALPIKDLPSARAVCSELKKRKIGCLVVRR